MSNSGKTGNSTPAIAQPNIIKSFNKIKVVNMRGLWGKKRIEFIKKCKIFINLHAENDYKILAARAAQNIFSNANCGVSKHPEPHGFLFLKF